MRKITKVLLSATIVVGSALFISACENTHVSTSVSYGVGYGYGYPMYYGGGYYNHTNVIVNRPPVHHRPRPLPAARPRPRLR